ncbi:hypothetical protein N2W29_002789 [Clostridium perfringens]|nr:hypothetical protein [Clostridium perfringens]WEV16231.1 hypothetical protein PL325_00985 [Clostridium perfringens D]
MAKKNTTTFIDNMKLPIHRWYRYSAGFSAEWVKDVINKKIQGKEINEFSILDPFSGSGTTIITGGQLGIKSYGFESHPLVYRIADAKLSWNCNLELFSNLAHEIINEARNIEGSSEGYPELIYKCYTEENIIKLDALKKVILNKKNDTPEYKLNWLAFVSILRSASHAGTAQWQYVLPNKSKVKVSDPYEAYLNQIQLMFEDMQLSQNIYCKENIAKIIKHDCREKENEIKENSIDLVITSPPYANNYDYADATRLELSFLGEISGWSDLQEYVRKDLMRSCTQHVSALRKDTFNIIEDDILKPIYNELKEVCEELNRERDNHGGKKNYHTMIATYFLDIAHILKWLRIYCKEDSEMCFVIGDSAPYGVYVPVDEWIGRLAISLGFKSYSFEKTRDRNTKWKNRKHDVLLKEGFLWIKG